MVHTFHLEKGLLGLEKSPLINIFNGSISIQFTSEKIVLKGSREDIQSKERGG